MTVRVRHGLFLRDCLRAVLFRSHPDLGGVVEDIGASACAFLLQKHSISVPSYIPSLDRAADELTVVSRGYSILLFANLAVDFLGLLPWVNTFHAPLLLSSRPCQGRRLRGRFDSCHDASRC
jgi:hypothetical protein